MNKTKTLCQLALGTALYVILSAVVKIPLLGHIQIDLGYIVFGSYLVIFGWKAIIVGVIGCLIESLIFSGWFPTGWIVGQVAIGLICGFWYKYSNDTPKTFKSVTRIIITILAVFLGIGIIKTAIECNLYSIPFEVKFAKDCVAFVADVIPMLVGIFIGERILKIYDNDKRKLGAS